MKPREFVDRYRKDPRFIVTVPLLVLAATSLIYYAIQKAKELSPEALSSQVLLFVLWNINVLLILGIVFVLLRGVAKVILERQRGIIGSRFRTKLVVTYMMLSLVPVALLFFVATDLLRVSIDRWFNTAAFTPNTPGVWGNVGRNTLRGPKVWNIDSSLSRRFQVNEKQRIELRAEAFNIFNHFNPGDPTTAINSANFGRITSAARDPRILQFAVKYGF